MRPAFEEALRTAYTFGLGFVVILLVTACAGAPVPAPIPAQPLPTPAPTTPPATLTPTAAPTPTPVPRTAATVIAAGGDREWNWVAIGDCTVGGLRGMPEVLEQDLGVELKFDLVSFAWSSGGMLRAVRTDERVRQKLRDAEVITFHVPVTGFRVPVEAYLLSPAGTCGGADNQDCLRQELQQFESDVDAIITEIISLRSPSDALIRAVDAHTHWSVAEAQRRGKFEVLNDYWQAANEHLVQVAGEHGIPVARVSEAFNGPDGDEDPLENGYVIPDHEHVTPKGADVMTELVRKLGYAYAPESP